MRDMDAIDLYNRVHIGTPVVVVQRRRCRPTFPSASSKLRGQRMSAPLCIINAPRDYKRLLIY
jgi:hypothetical protein